VIKKVAPMPEGEAQTLEKGRQRRIAEWRLDTERAQRVLELCATWLKAGDTAMRPEDWWRGLSDLPEDEKLQHVLRTAGEPVLAEAFEWVTEVHEGVPHPDAPAVMYSFAVACGQLYAEAGPLGAGWISALVWHADSQVWGDFVAAAARHFRADLGRMNALFEVARAVADRAGRDPDSVVNVLPGPKERPFKAFVEDYAANGNFDEVWRAEGYPAEFQYTSLFEILRLVDEAIFTSLLDALPHPSLVGQCLWTRELRTDIPSLGRLLRLACPSFSSEGEWQVSGKTAVLLLKTITQELLVPETNRPGFGPTDLVDDEDAAVEAEFREFDAVASEVISALMSRADSMHLGYVWLSYVLRYSATQARQRGRTRVIDCPFVLASAICAQLPPLPRPLEWVCEVEPMGRPYRVASVLGVAAQGNSGGRLDFRELASELIVKSQQVTGGSRWMFSRPMPVAMRLPGAALTHLPDFASWLTSTWSSLRLRREIAWRSIGKPNTANPAEALAIFSLSALEAFQFEVGQRREAAQRAWYAVEGVVREARLVEPRIGRDFWTRAVARLFEFWLTIVGDAGAVMSDQSPGSGALEEQLAQTISPYLGVNVDFMEAVASLRQSGVTPTQLAGACAALGADLSLLIRRFLETRKRLGDPQAWNPAWINALRAIANSAAPK
jgi:hypothetical protein